MDDLKQMIEDLRKDNSALKEENDSFKTILKLVKDQCLSTQVYAKRRSLFMHTIPNKDDKNIEESVKDYVSGM